MTMTFSRARGSSFATLARWTRSSCSISPRSTSGSSMRNAPILRCTCFAVKELGFSDGAAYNRLGVARAGRRWPAVLDALRSGAVHLSGLRVLVPHFTDENLQRLLAEAAGKSKREIEEMAARLSPKAPVPDRVWRVPQRSTQSLFEPVARTQPSADPTASLGPAVPVPRQQEHRPIVAPLTEDTFEMRFTAPRALRDKLRQAQD